MTVLRKLAIRRAVRQKIAMCGNMMEESGMKL